MPSGFMFEAAPTFRNLQGQFAKANKALMDERRPMVRTLGRRYVALAGEEAPGGAGHTVAKQVGFVTFANGETVGFKTRLGKIARWHAEGTGIYGPRGQLIRPKQAKALRFSVGGKILFRAWVRGVKPNAYLGRAYRRWLPGARPELRKIALRYTRTLNGSSQGGTA